MKGITRLKNVRLIFEYIIFKFCEKYDFAFVYQIKRPPIGSLLLII